MKTRSTPIISFAVVVTILLAILLGLVFINNDKIDNSKNPQTPSENNPSSIFAKWFLVSIDDVTTLDGVFIEFKEDNVASGFSGCNNFSGAYSLTTTLMDIKDLTSTLMFCEGTGGVVETKFNPILEEITVAELSNDNKTLTLTSDSHKLVFSNTDPRLNIITGKWNFTKSLNGTIETLVIAGAPVTVEFKSDGGIAGKACNSFSGTYLTNSTVNNLVIDGFISTKVACETPAGAMAQETTFLNDLAKAFRFEINGSTLKLHFESNKYLEFEKITDSI